MNTEFKAGTLYRLSHKHVLYGSELRNHIQRNPYDLIFLCTEKMYYPIIGVDDAFNYTTHKVHLLIDVESGGLWDTDPNKQEYEEYLQ